MIAQTLTDHEKEQLQEELPEMEIQKDDVDEHLAQGATVRARQDWDVNGERSGEIFLKCDKRLGQQKYMSCIVENMSKGK